MNIETRLIIWLVQQFLQRELWSKVIRKNKIMTQNEKATLVVAKNQEF